MNDDNRVVQGLWVGGRLSALERLCIRSFCAHGHEFHLYHYDELHNVPRVDGLRLMDGADILPRAAIFHHRKFGVVYFSDHFRWELLRQRGGWWMDMDTVCVRPLDFAAEVVFAGSDKWGRVLNGMLKFPRAHFLTEAMAQCYADINCIQPWDGAKAMFHKLRRRLMFWRDSRLHVTARDAGGLIGFMSAVRHYRLQKYMQPLTVFDISHNPQDCVIFGRERRDVDDILSAAPDVRCFHLSGTGFRRAGLSKDDKLPANSLYEILKRRYPEPVQ